MEFEQRKQALQTLRGLFDREEPPAVVLLKIIALIGTATAELAQAEVEPSGRRTSSGRLFVLTSKLVITGVWTDTTHEGPSNAGSADVTCTSRSHLESLKIVDDNQSWTLQYDPWEAGAHVELTYRELGKFVLPFRSSLPDNFEVVLASLVADLNKSTTK